METLKPFLSSMPPSLALRGDVRSSFALVRPPGHHAEADEALGFCFYNNVAVAAAAVTRLPQRPHAVERVAVLDWDVHHGNVRSALTYACSCRC